LAIHQSTIAGSPSVGVYSLATEKVVIVPKWVPIKKAERISRWLNTRLIHCTMGGSVLIGALACANSNGILLPNFTREEEYEVIKQEFEGHVHVMETKKNAYGNMVLANDRGAIVDPRLKEADLKIISDTLCVEAVTGEIAGLPYVGSLAVATNKGVLSHPLINDSERKKLEEVLHVPADVGTVNLGVPYVGTGLIANSHAAIVGTFTTGPEIFIIGNALDVVQEEEEIESLQVNG
jgi:translation initiation factor 6